MCIDFFYQEFAVLDPRKEKVYTNEQRLKFLQVPHGSALTKNNVGCNFRRPLFTDETLVYRWGSIVLELKYHVSWYSAVNILETIFFHYPLRLSLKFRIFWSTISFPVIEVEFLSLSLQQTEKKTVCFGKSAIHGWGLISRRAIQEGEMVNFMTGF